MKDTVFLISTIEDYGKLISFCIDNDVSVFRVYWDEREKGDRCYHINWKEKKCYYATRKHYVDEGYDIVIPIFDCDIYGNYKIDNKRCILCNENSETISHHNNDNSNSKHDNDKCSLGQMVDKIADEYFAKGYDAFYSNYMALVETTTYLINTHKILHSFLQKFLGGSNK